MLKGIDKLAKDTEGKSNLDNDFQTERCMRAMSYAVQISEG